MAMVVTGVGALIHVYATGYMADDPAYWRFFSFFNLFIFSMLLLVLGDNIIVMFFGWEGVGLCSYLLIGFWYRDYKKATCGSKAFIVNRIGDFGFICGIALLFWGLGGGWLDSPSQYKPDMRPRFVAVHVEALSHGAHGAEPGGVDHGAAVGHGSGWGQGHRPTKPIGPKAPPVKGQEELRAEAGTTGLLTMTTHPGAKVYFGVTTMEQLARQQVPDCRTLPGWNGGGRPALSPACYAVSPFLRKTIAAGGRAVHALAIVPGDGAVVVGDGDEVASLRVRVKPRREVVIAPVGSTVSFREIQDQLVMKDDHGKMFLRDALMGKRLWSNSWPLSTWGGIGLITLACLCFFLGATGKSAQIPLFTWLPDAMAGPTPVSALIHAATMVTAGVYMVARFNFLFSLSVHASGVVALVGALTAIFAASIGFFQYDIKKVLAYSTVSQLGFMFIGVGVGAYWAAVFHLMTHAFFKACLFLGSGSVIHGMHAVEHDEVAAQDMRNMGGLKRVMPRTAKTYFISCLAITAAPIPFFAGFWSKDEILWKAFNTMGTGAIPGVLIYGIGLLAALGTSFYMWRSYYLTFEGKHANKKIAKKVHESPGAMVNVLIVLAALSVFAGALFGFSMHFLGGHDEPLLEQWLHPALAHSAAEFAHGGLGTEYLLMGLSVGGAILAWHLARKRYGADRPKDWAEREQALPGFKLLNAKYYVDEIYDASFVRAVLTLRKLFAEMDRWIVDGLVNAVGTVSRAAAWATGVHDKYVVDGLVNLVGNATLGAGGQLRRIQTGRIQNYVYGILGGVLFFALLRYFLR